jgi:hypothetical protein
LIEQNTALLSTPNQAGNDARHGRTVNDVEAGSQ